MAQHVRDAKKAPVKLTGAFSLELQLRFDLLKRVFQDVVESQFQTLFDRQTAGCIPVS